MENSLEYEIENILLSIKEDLLQITPIETEENLDSFPIYNDRILYRNDYEKYIICQFCFKNNLSYKFIIDYTSIHIHKFDGEEEEFDNTITISGTPRLFIEIGLNDFDKELAGIKESIIIGNKESIIIGNKELIIIGNKELIPKDQIVFVGYLNKNLNIKLAKMEFRKEHEENVCDYYERWRVENEI